VNNDKINSIIDKLAEDTKNNLIKWDRIVHLIENNHGNILIANFLKEHSKSDFDQDKIFEHDSYYHIHNNGLVFILSMKSMYYSKTIYYLAIQSNSNAKVSMLNSESQLQSELLRLQYLIEEQLSDNDGFIDSLL